jgi:hypothetical protein
MSYDLYFKSKGQGVKLAGGDVASYFQQRKNYKVTGRQALYQNETTGVYCCFDLGDVEGVEANDLLPISFNLNYFRPHIFGIEAEREVKALVEKFGLFVFDPQTAGMGEGEYSTEGFLRSWNTGNEFGYKAILQQHADEKIFMLPTSKIEACWRWNDTRDDLQKELGDHVFVPRFMFVKRGGGAATTIVWPDGIPSAIPEADEFIIPRKEILAKRMFGAAQEDMALANWGDIKSILAPFPLAQGALPYRLVRYPYMPPALGSQLRRLSPIKEKLDGLSVDRILNAELVEKFQNPAGND